MSLQAMGSPMTLLPDELWVAAEPLLPQEPPKAKGVEGGAAARSERATVGCELRRRRR